MDDSACNKSHRNGGLPLGEKRIEQLRAAPQRVRRIIKWFLDNQDRLVTPDHVRITIHCGGGDIKVESNVVQTIGRDTGPLL